MRRALVIVAALLVVVYAATPPAARPLPAPDAKTVDPIRGAFHVHTRRSDGSGTVEQVAHAAAQAGLHFVVLSDHGDSTRAPDGPLFHHGVLMIDAVEISTDQGHVVALGAKQSPYPLAGEARDVVDDILRMGGSPFAAHPGSSKRELRWTDWTVPIAGLEHLNGDSEWRDESAFSLTRALLAYPVRSAQTVSLLYDRSEAVLSRWDELARIRPVVGLAAADAHGRIGLRAQEPYRGRLALPLPGYEAMFRSMSIALPGARMSTDPAVSARAVIDEIRAGRVFSSIDALGARPRFEFTATSGKLRAAAGDSLIPDGPVRFDVEAQAPPDAEIRLLRDGVMVKASVGEALRHDVDGGRGAFRIEVNLPGAPGTPPIPWITSNPIYVGYAPPQAAPQAARTAATTRAELYVDGAASSWTVEHSRPSQAALDVVKAVTGTQLLLRFALSGPLSSHPYAALVVPAGPALAAHDRLTFKAHANKPMRVSVQVRAPSSDPSGERWHRSVFVDTSPREISVWFDDMKPRGPTTTPRPLLDKVGWVLFVVDTVNTAPGSAGQLFLDDVRYER